MSALGKLKSQWNYERSVPRCEICTNYRKPGWVLVRDSLTRGTPPRCNLGGFEVKPAGCCDKWQGVNGQGLEMANAEGARP
jgi:hypothetical protein